MKISGFKRAILGTVSALLLGAFGSGLWETTMKPLGVWIGRGILGVVSLGSSAMKNQIYKEAAKGPHEASSLLILTVMIVLMTWAAAFLAGTLTGRWQSWRFRRKLEGFDAQERLRLLDDKKASIRRQFSVLHVAAVAVALFFIGNQFIQFLQIRSQTPPILSSNNL